MNNAINSLLSYSRVKLIGIIPAKYDYKMILLETIKVENGTLQNLQFHQERLDRSRFEFLGLKDTIGLKSIIKVPDRARRGVFKCRVVYGETIVRIRFVSYRARLITTLKIVVDNEIDYSYKYADRSKLEKLLLQKSDCDDILIVKNGLITDTSFSNIVFFDGTEWHTSNQPLLNGTKRESLLRTGKIRSCEIRIEDLWKYSKFALINAMLDSDKNTCLATENIIRAI